MSDFSFYADGIDDATLTYSATETTGYPVENIQDRNKNTILKDAPAVASVNIEIDFGNAKACDFCIIGNLTFSGTGGGYPELDIDYSDGGWNNVASAVPGGTNYDVLLTWSSQTKQIWRIVFTHSGGTVDNLEIGTVFLGTKFDLSKNPELIPNFESGYNIGSRETPGGLRRVNIFNTTVRRSWNYKWKYVTETEKGNYETWRDMIYMSNGLSRYPFYFTDDGGTTLYFVRTFGKLKFSEQAYQAYELGLRIEEEL